MQVKKRDGKLEDLNIDKLHKVVMYACEGITGVKNPSRDYPISQFYNGIASTDVPRNINQKVRLIPYQKTHPNYQYVAGRLIN